MRENLFRGLDKRYNKAAGHEYNVWRHGSLIEYSSGQAAIVAKADRYGHGEFTNEVVPETAGQYTGLDDKNGVSIFEGDVVTASWYDYEEPREDTFGEVIFNEGWCSYCIWNEAENVMSEMNGQGAYEWEIEVIGNIHDNPELVE